MLSVVNVSKIDEYIKHGDQAVKLNAQKVYRVRYLEVVFCKYTDARFSNMCR